MFEGIAVGDQVQVWLPYPQYVGEQAVRPHIIEGTVGKIYTGTQADPHLGIVLKDKNQVWLWVPRLHGGTVQKVG
jgi:hypothetical protein